ncbi:transcriptional repressor NrdR, partial [bacterium]|nr:transcriptional repressor NrdR [bacterium]
MRCPLCGQNDTRVVDSRLAAEDAQVRRRRACTACNGRFTTFEAAELKLPRVVKSDGTPEPFDEAKLRNAMERALYNSTASTEDIHAAIPRIKRNLLAASERDIATPAVAQPEMAELRDLD